MNLENFRFIYRSMNRIVFLDIDGVLNSDLWNEEHQEEIRQGILIDKEKIAILATLIRKTGAKIILHSGWRYWFDNELNPTRKESACLVDFLKEEGLTIDGMTPDLTTEEIRASKKFSLVKADEILLGLKQHDKAASWVVLDDLDLHNHEVGEHQVKTNPQIGLSYKDIELAEKIMEKQIKVISPKLDDIPACAKVYINAYKAEPWNEDYESTEVEKYISNFLDSDTKVCYVLLDGDVIKGVALGLIVPSISGPYLRLEDICIDSTEQRKGYGSAFMELLSNKAEKLGCDSVLLGTQKDFPSHRFYLKNGFQEVETVLLYKDIK